MKHTLAIGVLSSLLVLPAAASEQGYYIGLTLGHSTTEKADKRAGLSMSKDSDTVGGLVAGYQFNRYWAAEGFFTGAGKYETRNAADGDKTKGKVDVLGLSLVGTAPITDSLGVYAKLGVASAMNTYKPADDNMSTTHIGATYGVGVSYKITDRIQARLGWDRYAAKTEPSSGSDTRFNADVYSLGVMTRF